MPLSFANDIRPLFRPNDISEMKSVAGFDLSNYDHVKHRARDIHFRVKQGDMPCDGAWSRENVHKFKAWMDSGMQP
ncbi:MAG: hypothetical protein LC737_00780 [Chloroflexi bacterium]|nr:hypothetical protein [Chloroflexota bacterium]